MADNTSGGDGNSRGDDGDGPRGEIEAPRVRIDDQTAEGASASIGAEVSSIDSGNGGHAQGVGDGGDWRMSMPEGRTPMDVERTQVIEEIGGPWVH